MTLPKVTIVISGGNLGGLLATGDGVTGIILACHSAAPSGMTLGEAKRYTSLDAVKADGLDADFDTDNTTNAFRQVMELYSVTSNAVVWIMPVVNTEEMEDICDSALTPCYLKNLVEQSGYEVKVVGVCRKPDAGYTPTVLKGLDDDVIAAIAKAQAYCETLAAQGSPIAVILEGRLLTAVANLEDLKTHTDNYVGVVICGTSDTDKSASVGLVLGKVAGLPVQRNIGRVKDGDLGIAAAYTSDGAIVDNQDMETIHDLGYITIRKFRGKSGYYYTDDPLATATTDDFNTLSRRRTINKAILIAYNTYVNEINEEVKITTDGKIDPAFAKYFQGVVQAQLDTLMTSEGNVSSAVVFVNVDQNIISTNKLAVSIRLVPVGQAKEIEVTIGFSNPATT